MQARARVSDNYLHAVTTNSITPPEKGRGVDVPLSASALVSSRRSSECSANGRFNTMLPKEKRSTPRSEYRRGP